ncbi:MAG TPA: T9SS type A sorting domain-containing protein [Bacteroidales bacterium]|nr:T9SS type A sorting domain-containing protein [Bacteroidales bacterium]HRZ48477.1 T9SS type A sorting domain-containing protein [Bacteroidales bacterium]
MKRILRFLSLALIFSGSLFSQTVYFNKQYNPLNTWGAGLSIQQDSTGYNVIMIGGDSMAVNRNVVSFLKVDPLGSIQIQSTIQNDSIAYFCGDFGSLSIANDGYILGGSQNPVGPIQGMGILVRYNLYGDTLWLKTFYDTTYSEYLIFSQAKQTADGGFVAIGETRGNGTYATQFILIKTDSNGNEMWRKTYGMNNKMNRGTNILILPDGGFLLGGNTYSATLQDSKNGMVIKTDSLGNEIWRKLVGGFFNDGEARLGIAKDGNYIIGQDYAEWNHQGIPIGRLNIVKTDTSGSTIWQKKYGIPKILYTCSSVKVLEDGNIVAIGNSGNTDTGSTKRPGWIMKISNDGDSLWFREIEKYHPWGYEHNPYDFGQTPDGGFVVCGKVMDVYNGTFDDMWLVKLDSLGCDTPGCQYNSIDDKVLSMVRLKLFPNPSKEYFIIEYTMDKPNLPGALIEIRTIDGRLVKTIEVKGPQNQIIINTNPFARGMYLCLLKQGTNTLAVQKIVIEK